MSIQYVTLNPGSILLQKDYSWVKKFWYKLRNKELPYNYFTLFGRETAFLHIEEIKNKNNSIILTPKKAYSKKELKNLTSLIIHSTNNEDDWISSFSASTKDLFIIINAIRPGTFSNEETDLAALLNSRYYNTKVFPDECKFNEYTF